MPYLLGIDIGTSGTKTLICDENGSVLATAMAEHPISSPKPGWSEQNPEDWWKATCKATNAVLKRAKTRPTEIGGVGLSGQMHGSVFLPEGSTKPLRPALLWNDQRTAKQCDEITSKAGGREALIDLVANPALTGFTAPKILWVRENEPKVYEETRHVLLPKDYIRYRMTGEYATEVSDASGTLLLDVVNRVWSDKLLALLEIDKSLLPRLHESPQVTGGLNAQAASSLGLREGTPVVGGAGDQAAGAVGNGIVTAGIVSAMLIRSLLEGVTYGMRDALEIMQTMGCAITQVRASGGGARSDFWRHLQADIYQQPIVITNAAEGPAYGVALLAGVGTGVWSSVEEACKACIKQTLKVQPNKKLSALYDRHYATFAKLYFDLKERFSEITGLPG